MAPELFDKEKKNTYNGPAVDIFAMGVLLFMMLTSKFPFRNLFVDYKYFKALMKQPKRAME